MSGGGRAGRRGVRGRCGGERETSASVCRGGGRGASAGQGLACRSRQLHKQSLPRRPAFQCTRTQPPPHTHTYTPHREGYRRTDTGRRLTDSRGRAPGRHGTCTDKDVRTRCTRTEHSKTKKTPPACHAVASLRHTERRRDGLQRASRASLHTPRPPRTKTRHGTGGLVGNST